MVRRFQVSSLPRLKFFQVPSLTPTGNPQNFSNFFIPEFQDGGGDDMRISVLPPGCIFKGRGLRKDIKYVKIRRFPSLYRLWDQEKSSLHKPWAQKSEASRKARCESLHVAFSLYKSPETQKNSELSPLIQALGLEKIPSPLSEVRVDMEHDLHSLAWPLNTFPLL